jgi:hypothetical protein
MTEDRPGWRSEPETSSASGGHLSPDVAAGSAYDALSAPLPSERAASGRTEVIPRSRPEPPATGRGSRRRPGVRRAKRTVKSVDPVSVLKLSLFFYAVFLVLWLIFVAIVFSVLNSMGLFDSLEDILGPNGFVVAEDFKITLMAVEKWAFLIGLTMAVLGSIVNVFLSFLYNVAANTIGGIEMTFVERDV